MKMSFEYIRRFKNPLAKRNRCVLYDGQPMRMASTQDDTIVLRAEKHVHANDPGMICEDSQEAQAALRLAADAVLFYVTEGNDLWDEYENLDRKKIADYMKYISAGIEASADWIKSS